MDSLRFSLSFLFRLTAFIGIVLMSGIYLGVDGGALALIGGGAYWIGILLLAHAPYTSIRKLMMAVGFLAVTVGIMSLTLLGSLAVFRIGPYRHF